MNRICPRTEPCGTPKDTRRGVVESSFNCTDWVRSWRYDSKDRNYIPVIPNVKAIRRRRISWSTVSNAALRSNSDTSANCLFSIPSTTSENTLSTAVPVGWPLSPTSSNELLASCLQMSCDWSLQSASSSEQRETSLYMAIQMIL